MCILIIDWSKVSGLIRNKFNDGHFMDFFLSHVLPAEFRVLISVATFLSRAGMTLLSLTMESLCDIKHL